MATTMVTKKQFDNYYELIRKYFNRYSEHSHLQLDCEIYYIHSNTVYTELEYIATINGYLQIHVKSNTGSSWMEYVCKLNLIEVRMLYRVLRKKFGKI